jgi:hypothetical protein
MKRLNQPEFVELADSVPPLPSSATNVAPKPPGVVFTKFDMCDLNFLIVSYWIVSTFFPASNDLINIEHAVFILH